MSITVEATYENGQIKLNQPIALTDGSPVRVTITPVSDDDDPLDAVIGIGDGPEDGAENHNKYIYGWTRRLNLGTWP